MFHHFIFMMRCAPVLFLLPVFAIGVLDADDVESVSVSVMEGDSVTLHTDLTDKQDKTIEWKFEKDLIARGNDTSNKISWLDKHLGLKQLDEQTGNLRIKNIRTTDYGLYLLKINGNLFRNFSVTGVHNPRVDEMTVVSLSKGDSVVLHNDITKIQKDEEIVWTFNKEHVIARIIKDKHIFSTYDEEAGRIFRGKLQLNHQNGNVIISNVGPNTSGIYELDVKRKYHTLHNSFNVTIRDGQNQLSVKMGDSVILESGVKLDDDDQVQWRLEDFVIAEIKRTADLYDVHNERFGDRLKVNNETGSLTIDNIRNTDCGVYHLDIMGSRHVIFKKFILSVCCNKDLESDPWRLLFFVVSPLLGLTILIIVVYCCKRICKKQNGKKFKNRGAEKRQTI